MLRMTGVMAFSFSVLASACTAEVSAGEQELMEPMAGMTFDGGDSFESKGMQGEAPSAQPCGPSFCGSGERCCPATQECVPAGCAGCCSADDFYRFPRLATIDPESIPDVNIAGDPSGPGIETTPPASRPGSPDPGPMPPDP